MTAARSTYRRRRASASADLPDDLALWFAGEFEREEEAPPDRLLPSTRALLEAMPAHTLSRGERRALGLPVEPLRPIPWSALLPPDHFLLPTRWRAWKAGHRGAKPPPNWGWIDGAEPFKGHAALLEASALAAKTARRK